MLRNTPTLVCRLVCGPTLPFSEGSDELAAEGQDVGDDAAPDQVKSGPETSGSVPDGFLAQSLDTPLFLAGVHTGVNRAAREEAKAG
jgi:hypothetical protein